MKLATITAALALTLTGAVQASPLPDFPFINVTGAAKLEVAPDKARIQFVIRHTAAKADAATRLINATRAFFMSVSVDACADDLPASDQRVRWAAKTTQYTLPLSKIIALVVFITNLATILLPVLALNEGIDSEKAVRFFILKILVDAVFLTVTAQKFNQKIKWGTYLINSILYPLFSCTVALYSWTGKYQWKGRTFAQ